MEAGSESERRQLLLLIHGTFATAENDEGAAWWQRGSKTWQKLTQRLPPQVRLPDGPLFRWSGENSEWERHKAARELLTLLSQYEHDGQPYHLIGHSHGGSVVWTALKESVGRGVTLQHLKSWSTVGTPFLQYRATRLAGWTGTFVGTLIAIAALALAFLAYWFIWEWLGLSPDNRVWKNDWWDGVVVAGYVVLVLIVWAIILALLSPLFSLAFSFFRVHDEGIRVRGEKQVEQRAMKLYGHLWLGLWSEDDEAINGLNCTVGLKLKVVPRLAFTNDVAFSESGATYEGAKSWRGFLSAFYSPLIELLVAPWGDRQVSSVLAKSMQGNNRPGTVVEAVTVGPIPAAAGTYLPLPSEISRIIVDEANEAAKKLVPSMRSLLGQSALGSEVIAELRDRCEFTGAELVHTSYFHHPSVLHLLVAHIRHTVAGADRKSLDDAHDPLLTWYRDFMRCLEMQISEQPLANGCDDRNNMAK